MKRKLEDDDNSSSESSSWCPSSAEEEEEEDTGRRHHTRSQGSAPEAENVAEAMDRADAEVDNESDFSTTTCSESEQESETEEEDESVRISREEPSCMRTTNPSLDLPSGKMQTDHGRAETLHVTGSLLSNSDGKDIPTFWRGGKGSCGFRSKGENVGNQN